MTDRGFVVLGIVLYGTGAARHPLAPLVGAFACGLRFGGGCGRSLVIVLPQVFDPFAEISWIAGWSFLLGSTVVAFLLAFLLRVFAKPDAA